MKFLCYFLLIIFINYFTISKIEAIELLYNLQKDYIYTYSMSSISKGKLKPAGKQDWIEREPKKKTAEIFFHVFDILEKKDIGKIFVLEVKNLVKENDEETIIKISDKGSIIFENNEKKEDFFRDFSKSRFVGLIFPEMPKERVELDSKFKSIDIMMAFERDYNEFFPDKDVFVDDLKIIEHKTKKDIYILTGSNGTKFEKRGIQYEYKFDRYYEYDTKIKMITLGKFCLQKNTIPIDSDAAKERNARFSEEIWQIELLKINEKNIK